ncbi:MAG: nucleoside deaminase [Candidatus Midichloria mitochondrii]|nr:nucleoside deaminase [Candidatus Midichloria mitochondrii]
MIHSNHFMQYAINEARKAFDTAEVPVGAVIVCGEQIITKVHNLSISDMDITAHAEILALREASHKLQTRYLTECDLYVTLEPCAMCAYAISLARIRRLYFGAYDPKTGGVDHGPCIFAHSSTHHKLEYYGGIEERRCSKLLKDFFINKR